MQEMSGEKEEAEKPKAADIGPGGYAPVPSANGATIDTGATSFSMCPEVISLVCFKVT